MIAAIAKILELYGLPVGLLLIVALALAWAWKRERDENRTLNKELRESAIETTAALVAVKESSIALKSMLETLDGTITGSIEGVTVVIEKEHERGSKAISRVNDKVESIERKLVELVARMEV